MPRQAGLDAHKTLHHVMIRGLEGTQTFRAKEKGNIGSKAHKLNCFRTNVIYSVGEKASPKG